MSPRASDVENDATADQHGDARAVDDAGENVAAEFVGAEPVGGRRRIEAGGQVDGGGIVWGDPGSEQREDYEDHDQDHADGRQRIVAGISGDAAAKRDGGGRHESDTTNQSDDRTRVIGNNQSG